MQDGVRDLCLCVSGGCVQICLDHRTAWESVILLAAFHRRFQSLAVSALPATGERVSFHLQVININNRRAEGGKRRMTWARVAHHLHDGMVATKTASSRVFGLVSRALGAFGTLPKARFQQPASQSKKPWRAVRCGKERDGKQLSRRAADYLASPESTPGTGDDDGASPGRRRCRTRIGSRWAVGRGCQENDLLGGGEGTLFGARRCPLGLFGQPLAQLVFIAPQGISYILRVSPQRLREGAHRRSTGHFPLT